MENQNYSLLLFLLITYVEKKKRATRKVRTVSGPGATKFLQIQALYERMSYFIRGFCKSPRTFQNFAIGSIYAESLQKHP